MLLTNNIYNFYIGYELNYFLLSSDVSKTKFSKKSLQGKHILKVLNLSVGGKIKTIVPNKGRFIYRIIDIDEDMIYLEKDLSPSSLEKNNSKRRIRLFVGLCRSQILKRVFRDCTSIGISYFGIFPTELTEKSYIDSSFLSDKKYTTQLEEGMVQGGQFNYPNVEKFSSLSSVLKYSSVKESVTLVLDNVLEGNPLISHLSMIKSQLKGDTFINVVIGSERGFTDKERELFLSRDNIICHLGETPLRTDTASIIASSLVIQGINLP